MIIAEITVVIKISLNYYINLDWLNFRSLKIINFCINYDLNFRINHIMTLFIITVVIMMMIKTMNFFEMNLSNLNRDFNDIKIS